MGCWLLKVDWAVLLKGIGAITQSGAAIAQGLAAIVVAVASLLALGTWRAQLLGTRRQAVAEECLCNAYQIQDMLRSIRHPISWGHEMDAVPAQEGETEWERRARAPYGVVELRFAPFAEAYAAMATSRFRLKAVFGDEVHDSFVALLTLVTEVRNAALNVLSARRDAEIMGDLPHEAYAPQLETATKRLLDLEALVWGSGSQLDEVAKRVSGLVTLLERHLKDSAAVGTSSPPKRAKHL